jgi:hypothetical protein
MPLRQLWFTYSRPSYLELHISRFSLELQLLTNGRSNYAHPLQACGPLLQALHDLAVCVAAGLGPGCKKGLVALQQQLQQESLYGETLPPEGEQRWLSICIQKFDSESAGLT